MSEIKNCSTCGNYWDGFCHFTPFDHDMPKWAINAVLDVTFDGRYEIEPNRYDDGECEYWESRCPE